MATMHDKFEVAAALRETGVLLNASGENSFKAKAYLNAARALESANLDFGRLIKEDRLQELPGVGASIAAYITELYKTGETPLLTRLRNALPPGVLELSQIDGMTVKRIQLLHDHLGISCLAQLEQACKSGKVAAVKGLGPAFEKKIAEAIFSHKPGQQQILLVEAREIAAEMTDYFKSKGLTVTLAGRARQWFEALSSIELVCDCPTAAQAKKALSAFKTFHMVAKVIANENDHRAMTVLLTNNITATLYAAENFALELFTRTGSDAHINEVRHLAKEKGFELTATTFKSRRKKVDSKIEVDSEDSLYRALDLPYIPPELRDHAKGALSAAVDATENLVDISDIQGITHCHSTFSDGRHSIEQMARAAMKMGMKYITLTDHSPTAHYAGGLSLDRLKEQWEEIDRVQELLPIRIFKGTECDILADGKLDYPDHILDKFDIIIASIHSRYKQDEGEMTKRLLRGLKDRHFKVWGHPLGRLVLKRDPIPVNVEKLLDAVADARLAIEINGDPHRLDFEPRWARMASERGLKFVISTDAHAMGELQNLTYGVHMARRAGLQKSEVLNCLPLEKFKKAVKAR